MFVILFFLGSASGGFLIRDVLILLGFYKAPILVLFQRYGGDDPIYYPLPMMLLWFGLLIISVGGMLPMIDFPSFELGMVILFLAYLAREFQYPKNEGAKPVLPVWYRRFVEDTTRAERRRVAYMWLRMPLRTRLLLNASDYHFFLWVDLIVIATIEEV